MHVSKLDTFEPILSVSNLSVEFSRSIGTIRRRKSLIRAVDNVSFEIYQSEILSVVGESGSGKTTIARSILRLNNPTNGSIKYNGVEITRLKGRSLRDYRRDVQIIYQDPFESINPRRDVLSVLSIPMKRLVGEKDDKKIREKTIQLLFEVGLDADEVLHKFPHQLSGGERQRVNIARALAPNPKLLIADEPITMLDASQRLNILSLIMKLKSRRNLTVLMITHDLASAKIMSNRTAVMYSGKLVEIGPTSVILSKPNHPYTETILFATPRLQHQARALDDIAYSTIDDAVALTKGCVFAARCKYATSVCKEVEPALSERAKTHLAACHNPLNIS
jgi:peptide/nickel transport system ATP-binding protein